MKWELQELQDIFIEFAAELHQYKEHLGDELYTAMMNDIVKNYKKESTLLHLKHQVDEDQRQYVLEQRVYHLVPKRRRSLLHLLFGKPNKAMVLFSAAEWQRAEKFFEKFTARIDGNTEELEGAAEVEDIIDGEEAIVEETPENAPVSPEEAEAESEADEPAEAPQEPQEPAEAPQEDAEAPQEPAETPQEPAEASQESQEPAETLGDNYGIDTMYEIIIEGGEEHVDQGNQIGRRAG